mgnify:FL=1
MYFFMQLRHYLYSLLRSLLIQHKGIVQQGTFVLLLLIHIEEVLCRLRVAVDLNYPYLLVGRTLDNHKEPL